MKFYTPLLALLLILGACGNRPDTLSEIKDPTPADSMMYYFGIMQASSYLHDADTDTMLLTEQGREEFIKGFREAMKMDSNDECYNKGLQLGLRLAIRLREFKNAYGMDFPEEILAASFEQYISSDSTIDIAAAQKGYYKIKDLLDHNKELKDVECAKKGLAERAKKDGYVQVSDTLYAKDISQAGNGPKFKDGDRIAIKVNAATIDGRELGRQFPDTITIGAGRVPRVVCLATHTMTDGQTRIFMTTPQTLFGNQYTRYQLQPSEPVVFTVKAERN